MASRKKRDLSSSAPFWGASVLSHLIPLKTTKKENHSSSKGPPQFHGKVRTIKSFDQLIQVIRSISLKTKKCIPILNGSLLQKISSKNPGLQGSVCTLFSPPLNMGDDAWSYFYKPAKP
jgi:hypothetical protein